MYQDFVFVVNEETEKKHDMYVSIDHQISTELEELYGELFRFRIANYIGVYYHEVFSKYRNDIKRIISNQTSRRRVLKNIYEFETDFAMFDRIYSELDWEREEKKVLKCFPEIEKVDNVRPIFRNLTTSDYASNVRRSLGRISDNKNQILEELNRKSDLIKHKRDFENENRDFKISMFMLVITLLTLMVVIFDGLDKTLASYIDVLWGWINSHYIPSIVMLVSMIIISIWKRLTK